MKNLFIFLIGGAVYVLIELLYRGHSHISMFVLGGLLFLLIGLLNEFCFSWDMALISQMFISMVMATLCELIAGLILNVWLGLGIWDYYKQPFNLCGQICLLYANIWFLLSLPAILLDDLLRDKWFGESRKHYKIF